MISNSEIRIHNISKKILLSFLLSFISSGTIAGILIYFDIQPAYIEIISTGLLIVAEMLLFISWTASFIFILLGKPSFSHVWLEGMSLPKKSYTPWEQLTISKKTSVYFYSILLAFFAITGLVIAISNVSLN